MNPTPQFETLVLDAGPLIKDGLKFKDYAKRFVTIQEVFNEVRDKRARAQLELFPYEIEIITPTPEAVRAVANFAKKTGDFAVLSSVDLRVMALTYMIEQQTCGIQHLRTEPLKPHTQVGAIKQPKAKSKSKAKSIDSSNNQDNNESTELETDLVASTEKLNLNEEKDTSSTELEQYTSEIVVEEKNSENDLEEEGLENNLQEGLNNNGEANDLEAEEQDEESDSDDGEWITPSNLKQKQQEFMGEVSKEREDARKVACITTDYAMQNVMLQMNLGLVSVDGLAIKQIKSWIFRCHACYNVTSDMSKQFCPKCGGPNLNRVSCSVDRDGQVRYYLKKNYQYNIRGNKFAIPTFKGGHNNKDLIIAEDQREYERASKYYLRRKEKDLFDPDSLPSILTGHDKSLPQAPVIGFGKRNPNKANRRSGRKKS